MIKRLRVLRDLRGLIEAPGLGAVCADGTVGEVDVTKALHPKLDASAIAAARQWLFNPGQKDGKPADVAIEIEMTFTLK